MSKEGGSIPMVRYENHYYFCFSIELKYIHAIIFYDYQLWLAVWKTNKRNVKLQGGVFIRRKCVVCLNKL